LGLYVYRSLEFFEDPSSKCRLVIVHRRGPRAYPSGCDDTDRATDTFRVFSLYSDSDISDFCPYILNTYDIETFNRNVCKWVTKENINNWEYSPIFYAIEEMAMTESGCSTLGQVIIQNLIALGADLHENSRLNTTLLEEIMDIVNDPFESFELGKYWIDCLRKAGVDVGAYLRKEQELLTTDSESRSPLRPIGGRERKLIISIGEIPSVYWDWYPDSEGKAFDALQEFRHFGPKHHSQYMDFRSPSLLKNWPFSLPDWIYCMEKLSDGDAIEDEEEIAKLFEARFERRWHKKRMKLARAQGIRRGPRIPGAWID